MTSISASIPTRTPATPRAPTQPAARAAPGSATPAAARGTPFDATDLRAMRDALQRAGKRMAKADKPAAPPANAAPMPTDGRTAGLDRALVQPRQPGSRGDHDEDMPQSAVLALAGQAGAPPSSVTMPNAPAPQVDASAFAALIGQLWAREQAKGTREVQIRFGERAWPATGARLVRAADGSLDVTLLSGGGGQTLDRNLGRLREKLSERGVAVGALGVEDDA